MANTSDTAPCFKSAETKQQGLLTLSPYYSLNYHFGMLLGAEDFDTQQAYHRGKMRLHNAWLHRAGVIWGFDVRLDPARGELRVLPGLALDGAGHELHLEGDACLNVPAWLEANRKDSRLVLKPNPAFAGSEQFDGWVSIRFRSCLTRQVPALAEPCEGAALDTAYSRVFETILIQLEPGPAPPRARPYHRLRLLFALDEPLRDSSGVVTPEDQPVLDARDAVLALPYSRQPAAYLEAFERFAALDEIGMGPVSETQGGPQLFPAKEDEPVILAAVRGLTVQTQGAAKVVVAGEVDCSVRPAHVATATIQDLLCGPLFRMAQAVDAGGPRVDPASVVIEDKTVSFRVDKPLQEASVVNGAFAVSEFVDKWRAIPLAGAEYDAASQTVKVQLREAIKGRALVRLIVRGTGPTPLLGADLVPLAGGRDGPPASKHNGNDFVLMQKGGSDGD